MQCLICNGYVPSKMDLKFILSWQKIKTEFICLECKGDFVRLQKNLTCLQCGRKSPKKLCVDCLRWNDELRNTAMYEYNDAMKEYFNRYKFLGDYYLANVFKREFSKFVNSNLKPDEKLVAIPVDELTMESRGFNQVTGLVNFDLPRVLKSERPSERVHQYQLTRKERLKQINHFILNNKSDVFGEKIVILDDIYTTGKTVRDAARVIKEGGSASVRSITLCR